MKISDWYSLKENEKQISIKYKLSSRILSVVSFILILSFLIFYILESKNNDFSIGYVLILILLVFLLMMALLEDAYIFYVANSQILKMNGIYPFIKKQSIGYDLIEGIEVDKVKKKSFLDFLKNDKKKLYFTITIHYKDRKSEPLGLFSGEDNFNIAQSLKNIRFN